MTAKAPRFGTSKRLLWSLIIVKKNLIIRLTGILTAIWFGISLNIGGFAQTNKVIAQTGARSVTFETEPNASLWIDGVRYGTTDQSGKLTVKNISAGTHTLRVRAAGFKEVSQNLTGAQKGSIKIVLTKTTDEAELAFQQAESSLADKQKAAELYEKAVKLRPNYVDADLGLARVLSTEDLDGALKAVGAARRARPANAEASAVEGRIYKDNDNEEKAIASFKRALVEGKNFQPEALAGLGLIYKERAENFSAKGDFEQEKAAYDQSAKYLQTAVRQLAGAPDAELIYQLLGLIYEKTDNPAQAIKVYEEFLKVFPDSADADAVRSFIVQARSTLR